jgi:replicative superfamily II helicase
MAKQILPCADKNCKNKMRLTENNTNILYYKCLKYHNEHAYRYHIKQKKWEKLIIKTKILLSYNEDPCKEYIIEPTEHITKIRQPVKEYFNETEFSSLMAIKGIGAKRAKELENAGIKNISDLAKCSPKYLAEKTGIPIVQISNWIIEANNLREKILILSA